ncbi:MAG TPA: radical SAM protein [Anaerolineaceae bacterium]|nr:radical SAM protein [Anaerolineaceae bacterium]
MLPAYLTPSRPTTYTFELTPACTHDCLGCGNVFARSVDRSLRQAQGAIDGPVSISSVSAPGNPLDGAAWIDILERLRPHLLNLRLTGGEPTLHPDFPAILQAVERLEVPFVLFSNGCWAAQRAQEIVELLSACRHLDGVLVSLHGADAAAHAAYVGRDTFDEVCANITRLAQAGVRVGTNTLLLRSTAPQLERVAALSLGLGASSVHFSRYYGPALPEVELPPEELRAALRCIDDLHRNDRRVLFNNCIPLCFYQSSFSAHGCTSGFTHATIDPWGWVRPCTHTPLRLGSILDQPIESIWQGEELRQWRARVPEPCLACGQFGACRGGCRATAYQLGLAQDPLITGLPPEPLAPPSEALRLPRLARPRAAFTLRRDGEVIYLFNRNRSLAVAPHSLPVLEALDGSLTLEELRARFGPQALDFVGVLVQQGLVRIED